MTITEAMVPADETLHRQTQEEFNYYTPEVSRPKPASTDYEKLVDNDENRIFAMTATRNDGSKVSFIPIGSNGAEKAEVLLGVGYSCELLTSKGDEYTEKERQFAKGSLNYSEGQLRYPYRQQLKPEPGIEGHSVIFFEPTAQSLIDIMRLAGYDDSALRQARLDAKQGNKNELVDALDVLVAASRDAKNDKEKIRSRVINDTFGVGVAVGTWGVLENAVENGPNSGSIRNIQKKLKRGFSPDLMFEVGYGGNDVNKLMQKTWEDGFAYAKEHNRDPSGIYTEVHKLGEQYIVLPALSSTAWDPEHNDGFGFVYEGSDHCLAEIYEGTFNLGDDERLGSIDRQIKDQPVVELSTRLGLGRKTLVSRGRIDENGYTASVVRGIETYKTDSYSKDYSLDELARLIVGLKSIGLTTRVNEYGEALEIDYVESDKIKTVKVNKEWVDLPKSKRNYSTRLMIMESLKITSAVEFKEDHQGKFVDGGLEVNIGMTESFARRHADIYEQLGLEENAMNYISFGDVTFGVAGRYTPGDQTEQREPEIRIMLHASEDDVMRYKNELATIFTALKDNLDRDDFSEEKTKLVINFSNDPKKSGWKAIRL